MTYWKKTTPKELDKFNINDDFDKDFDNFRDPKKEKSLARALRKL